MSEPRHPRVSVVMGVRNDARNLPRSVASILGQSYRDLELIVVDDGSDDGSAEVLAKLAAADTRLRVLRQESLGLTKALIRGCAEAKGEFIARQDSDDWSCPDRIAAQVALLDSDARIGFVSCTTRYVGPGDERLFELSRAGEPEMATLALLYERQGPPAHGSVMFRADLYRQVGGYRHEFRFAQDSDLWLRMAERAWIAYVPELGYVHRKEVRSTSGIQRPTQKRLGELGHLCRQARLQGQSEEALLADARALSEQAVLGGMHAAPSAEADAAYLLGSQLYQNGDSRARPYFWQAVRAQPLHLRAWTKLAASLLWLPLRALAGRRAP